MTFDPILPWWGLAAVVLAGFILAWVQYQRSQVYGVKRFHRAILFSLRFGVFLIFAILLSNPQWSREVRSERPARLIALFDVSESMNSAPSPQDPTAFERLRDGFFRRVYPLWQDRSEMRFYTFSSEIATTDGETLSGMETATGAATNIRGAVLDALSQQGANLPAAVIMLTDGNHNWGPEPTFDIFIPPGTEDPLPLIAVSTPAYGEIRKSLAIPQVTLPNPVFSDEDTEVRYQIIASGAESVEAEVNMTVERKTEEEGQEVWRPVDVGESQSRIPLYGASSQGTFNARFSEGGDYRIQLAASAAGLGSASTAREIKVEPGRWRIAYYAGRPGWMNSSLIRRLANVPRYALRAAINREEGSWGFVVSGRREEEELEKAYLSLEEVAHEADLFIFEGISGDQTSELPPEIISERLAAGAAVLIIAGEGQPPQPGFLDRLGMKDLAPVDMSSVYYSPSKREVRLTAEGATHHVTSSPSVLALKGRVPSGQMPHGNVKATEDAQTLFAFGNDAPVLVVRTVGESRSAYIGISDLWRWQFQPGEEGETSNQAFEVLADRLIRWLIVGEEEDFGTPVIMISQSRVPLGKTLEIGVQYYRATSEASATVLLVATDPSNRSTPLTLNRKPGGFFTTRFTPDNPGEYTFAASDAQNPSASDTAKIRVEPFSVETAISGAREDLLRNLAEKTGGVWVDVEDISALSKMDRLDEVFIPRVVRRTVTEPMMSAPWFFLLLILMFCSEWTIRRLRDLP